MKRRSSLIPTQSKAYEACRSGLRIESVFYGLCRTRVIELTLYEGKWRIAYVHLPLRIATVFKNLPIAERVSLDHIVMQQLRPGRSTVADGKFFGRSGRR